MFGTIEIPEPFYDYDKKDKAEVDARWALEMAARAAAEAEKKASKQAAVLQAKADEAAVQAAQAAKRAANKAEKTEKAAGHKAAGHKAAGHKAAGHKQEAAVQVQHGYGHTCLHASARGGVTRALSPLSLPLALSCKEPSRDLWSVVASGPRDLFRNGEFRAIYPSFRFSPSQAKKAAPSFHGVIGILLSIVMLFVAFGQCQI